MHPGWAYLALFTSALIENLFPPIPGDTVTVIGAYLVGQKILHFWGVFVSTTAGSIMGFMGLYGFAFWLERKVIERYKPDWVSWAHVEKVEGWFHHYGYWIILLNRFLSGVRSVISLVAGLLKLEPLWVFLLALISCMVWNGGLIYLGSILGKHWEEIARLLSTYNKGVIISIAAAVAVFVVFQLIQKRVKQKLSRPD
jgi:membrane protein DedA with SNARE-associated domain